MLLASLLLTLLIFGIFWIAQKFCGCCKQKKEVKKVHEVIVESHKPKAPAPVRVPQPVHVAPQYTNVTYGEPKITYGKSNVIEHRDQNQHYMERRHVETRQLSPDRHSDQILYSDNVDWAKESNVRHNRVEHQGSYVSGGHQPQAERRVVRNVSHTGGDYNNQYNPFSN